MPHIQYIPRNMHTVFALLCFVVVIHWLIFPYPSGLLHSHCGNLTIVPVPAKQPWWIWINTSCEFIMNDCITTTKQSTTKPCAYFLGYTVYASVNWITIAAANGLSPARRECIARTDANLLSIRLDHWERLSMKFELKYNFFHSWKCVWSCRPRNGGDFVQGEMSSNPVIYRITAVYILVNVISETKNQAENSKKKKRKNAIVMLLRFFIFRCYKNTKAHLFVITITLAPL